MPDSLGYVPTLLKPQPGPWMSYFFGDIPCKFVGQNPKRKDIQGPGSKYLQIGPT